MKALKRVTMAFWLVAGISAGVACAPSQESASASSVASAVESNDFECGAIDEFGEQSCWAKSNIDPTKRCTEGTGTVRALFLTHSTCIDEKCNAPDGKISFTNRIS